MWRVLIFFWCLKLNKTIQQYFNSQKFLNTISKLQLLPHLVIGEVHRYNSQENKTQFKHNIHLCRLSKVSDISHASYRILIFDSLRKRQSRCHYERLKFAISDWNYHLYANVKSRAIITQMKAFVHITIVNGKDNT